MKILEFSTMNPVELNYMFIHVQPLLWHFLQYLQNDKSVKPETALSLFFFWLNYDKRNLLVWVLKTLEQLFFILTQLCNLFCDSQASYDTDCDLAAIWKFDPWLVTNVMKSWNLVSFPLSKSCQHWVSIHALHAFWLPLCFHGHIVTPCKFWLYFYGHTTDLWSIMMQHLMTLLLSALHPN